MLRRALVPFAFLAALLFTACGGSQSRPAPAPEPGGGAGGAATGGAQTRTTVQTRPSPQPSVDSTEALGGADEDDGEASSAESIDGGGMTDDASRDVTRMMSDLTLLEGSLDAVELGASPEDCDTGRVLGERICELAERICRLEGELGGRCQDARQRCRRGRDRLSDRCE